MFYWPKRGLGGPIYNKYLTTPLLHVFRGGFRVFQKRLKRD